MKSYPAYATPRAVWWTLEPWTIAAGLLTPTLKNKRAGLENRFAAEIEQIYARRPPSRSHSANLQVGERNARAPLVRGVLAATALSASGDPSRRAPGEGGRLRASHDRV